MPADVPSTQDRVLARLAQEFDSDASAIGALLSRLEQGGRIPYLSTFERENFGVMSASRMYEIRDRLHDLKMLEEQKTIVLEAAGREGWLDDETRARIQSYDDLDDLEDAWQAIRRRHSGPAKEARERGLVPLAEALRARSLPEGQDALTAAAAYVDEAKGVPDARAALDGARAILIEEIEAPKSLVDAVWETHVQAVARGKLPKGQGYEAIAKLDKAARKLSWEETLRLRKAVREGFVHYEFGLSEEKAHQVLAEEYAKDLDAAHPLRAFWDTTLRSAWLDRLKVPLERQVQRALKTRADNSAIRAFAENYRKLLLAAPWRDKKVLGVLPAIRRPARFALIDAQAKNIAGLKLSPMQSSDVRETERTKLRDFVEKNGVEVVALGAGPGCREFEQFVLEAIEGLEARPQMVTVSEENALGMQKRAKGDVGAKKASALARRVQDPLYEWSRIDPMQAAIGDLRDEVYQSPLARRLESVREDVLHEMGVDLERATTDTLALIGGMGRETALKILLERDSEGGLTSLQALAEKQHIGASTLDDAGPFLRLAGSEPLDALRIPPSQYGRVEEIAASLSLTKAQLLEKPSELERIQHPAFQRDDVAQGVFRVVLDELRAPTRDTRPNATPCEFSAHKSASELEMGTEVQGRIMRLADFGAFVDVGVAPAGLLHVSQMADRFVGDPSTVVQAGQIVSVRVLENDVSKGRLSLTMRQGDIRKVQLTLADAASNRRRPTAVVVKPGSRDDERYQKTGRFEQGRGNRGGRGGAGGGGRGKPGERRGGGGGGRRDDRRDGRRDGRGGKRGGDFRDRGGDRMRGTFTVESEELVETMNSERGFGGELKSFAALAAMASGSGGDKSGGGKGGKKDKKKKGKAPDEAPKREEAKAADAPRPAETEAPTPPAEPPAPSPEDSAAAPEQKPASDTPDFGGDFV